MKDIRVRIDDLKMSKGQLKSSVALNDRNAARNGNNDVE